MTAKGAVLPYVGGVAGYNSGYAAGTNTVATIENCYSAAAVAASLALDFLGGGRMGEWMGIPRYFVTVFGCKSINNGHWARAWEGRWNKAAIVEIAASP